MNNVFLLFVLLILFILYTVLYFVLYKQSDKSKLWGYWAAGAGAFIVLGIVVFYCNNQRISLSKKYHELNNAAKNNPECKTKSQQCIETNLSVKRANDSQRPNITTLERRVRDEPNNLELAVQLRQVRSEVARDVNAIDQCKNRSQTNPCIEKVLDACQSAIKAKGDPIMTEQFIAFRKDHPAPDVLSFCNSAVSRN